MRFNPWPWIRPFIVLVLVVTIPPLVYWFVYVQRSVDATKHQAFVTVSAVSSDFHSRLDAYSRLAETAEQSIERDPDHLRGYLKSLLSTNPVKHPQPATTHLAINATTGELQLSVRALCASPCERQVTAVIPLANLISWDVVESVFDGLVVLNDQGELVTQDRRLPVQPGGIPVRLSPAAAAALAPIVKSGSRLNSDSPAAADKKAESFVRLPTDTSDVPVIEISGERYVAFMQPISVALTPLDQDQDATQTPAPLHLIVAGLIKADVLQHTAYAMSPEILTLVGSFVALGLFSIPFLKLRFIGARERVRVRDVWMLAGSVLSATVLVALLILQAHADARVSHRFDKTLERFTQSVQDHVQREGDAAQQQLRALLPELAAPGTGCTSLAASKPGDTTPACASGSILATARDFDYPLFEVVFTTNAQGMQSHKWMPRTIPTGNINVRPEGYFDPTLTLPDSGSCTAETGCPFYFSSTVAPTSALLLGVYSTPIGASGAPLSSAADFRSRTGIAGIATPLVSVNAPIVPHPFQFVVVDTDGKVVFQAAQGPFRGERFFDSVSGGATLKRGSAIHADDRLISTHLYRGHQYRMLAQWVPSLHATLVTYYDREEIGSLTSRVFAITLVFAIGIIASILLGAALARPIFGPAALDWAWPAPGRTPYHLLGIAVSALLIAVYVLAHLYLAATWVNTVFLFLPALVILFTGAPQATALAKRLVQGVSSRRVRTRPDCGWFATLVFETFAIVAVMALVGVPTMIVYEDVFAVQSAGYQEVVHRDVLAEIEKQRREMGGRIAVVSDTLPEAACAGGGSGKADLRCNAPERVYMRAPTYDRYVRSLNELGRYIECVDPSGEDNRGCDATRSTVVPWSFSLYFAYRAALITAGNADLAQAFNSFRQTATSDLRAGTYNVRLSIGNVGGFTILIAALLLVVNSVSKHVLGLGVTSDGVLDGRDAFAPADRTRWLLLRPPHDVTRALAARAGPERTLDLREHGASLEALGKLNPQAGEIVLVKHVESRLDDPEWRQQLLPLIGNPKAGCVVMTAEIDPFHFFAQRLREIAVTIPTTPDSQAATDDARYETARAELSKWAAALTAVNKVRFAAPTFDVENDGTLSPEAYAMLAQECGASEPLIEIGRQIMRAADVNTHEPSEIIGFVQDAAEPYYRGLWDLSSREEKLVLVQLAQEGLVNPRSIDLVMRLARRRILRVNPRFSLMNESFRRFICNAESPERVAQWERGGQGFTWSRLGTPLYALAAVVIAILLFTQQSAVTNILAIATGATGALGSLRGLYAAVKGPASAAKLV